MVAENAKILTANQIIRIHEASLEILREVGIEVHNDHARDIYQKHGCQVNRDSRRVLFPVQVVEEYRQMTSGEFTMYGRDPQYDKTLPHDGPLLMNGSSAPYIIDPVTGAQRFSTSADIANVARLAHELSGFDFFSVALLAADAPVEMYNLYRFYPALKNCAKPVRGGMETTQNPEKGAEDLLKLLYLFAGGKELYHERPFVLLHACPIIAPLKMDAGSTALLIYFTEKGLPVYSSTVCNGGLTSPIPLAGTLAQSNAEYLAMNVLQQMVNPGRPYLYGALPTIMDTKSGAYASGAIECGILNMALCQMAHYYQVPYSGYMGLTNSKLCDTQAGYEKALSSMGGMMSGLDIIIMGMLIDALMAFDYAQAIVDNEIALMIKQASRPIDTSDEMLSLDLIKETGPGGSFVESDQTLAMRYTAAFEPQVADRDFRASWEARGGKEAKTVALEAAREILTGPLDLLLDRQVDAELRNAFCGLPEGEIVLPEGW